MAAAFSLYNSIELKGPKYHIRSNGKGRIFYGNDKRDVGDGEFVPCCDVLYCVVVKLPYGLADPQNGISPPWHQTGGSGEEGGDVGEEEEPRVKTAAVRCLLLSGFFSFAAK